MAQAGYSEQELVSNRASVLLYGGSDRDRKSWAEQAHAHVAPGAALVEVTTAAALPDALLESNGVVFIPDVGVLPPEAQAALVRCLQEREERPKIIVGLGGAVEEARSRGLLREDLLYRLDRARVDLSVAENREALRKRSTLVARAPVKNAAAKSAPPRPAARPLAKSAKKPARKNARR